MHKPAQGTPHGPIKKMFIIIDIIKYVGEMVVVSHSLTNDLESQV